MNKAKLTKFAIPFALSLGALTGCGGSEGVPDAQNVPVTPANTVADVSGSAVKGALSGATVVFEPAGSDVQMSASPSGSDGSFGNITLTSKPGFGIGDLYRITVSAAGDSTMICDAVACGSSATGDVLSSDQISGLELKTMTWVTTTYGNASDSTMDGTFQTSMLTTMANRLLEISIAEEGTRVSSADLLSSAQINVSNTLMKILGLSIKDINIFNMTLASAEAAGNFDGMADVAMQLSLVNGAFSAYAEDSDLATTMSNAMQWMEAASREEDLQAATALRQYVIDALTGHTVATDLGMEVTSFLDINLPLGDDGLISRPIVEYTVPEYINDATITFRAQINEAEGAAMAFDGTEATKWLDNGGTPSVDEPAWIQVEFAEPVPVSAIAISAANWDQRPRDIENFNIIASNDGVIWNTLGEFEGILFASMFDTKLVSFANGLAYKMYRVNITKNRGDQGLTSVSEIEFFGLPVADVNHSLTDAKTITARAEINEAEGAPMAFDGTEQTKWLDNGGTPSADEPAWVQVEFDEAKAVNTIAIRTANWDQRPRDVENFNLIASNDGEVWSTLIEVEGVIFARMFDRKQFAFVNGLPFKYYRVVITKNRGDQGLTSMSEIELIGPEVPEINHALNNGKTITGRAQINEAEGFTMAFDGTVQTKWLDNGGTPTAEEPAWIQVVFDEPKSVNTFAIHTANWDQRPRDVENFTLLASNDGETWFTLVEGEGVTFRQMFDRQQFPFANGLSYTHYRLNITKNFGDQGLTSMSELQLIGPEVGKVNHALTDGKIVTGRAQINEAEGFTMAFDGTTDTKWLDNGGTPTAEEPAWIQIQLPEAKVVDSIAIYAANWDQRLRDVENFELLGSVDGVEWVSLTEVEGVVFARMFDRQQFTFVNGRALTYYRLNITKNFSDSGLTSMSEIELIGNP